jgi:hypothetical protein
MDHSVCGTCGKPFTLKGPQFVKVTFRFFSYHSKCVPAFRRLRQDELKERE